MEQRRAESIEITDADQFFSTLQEHVESLQEFARPHPLSTEAAVTSLKRYLPEPGHRIRLSELVDGVVEQVVQATSGGEFSIDAPRPDPAVVTARLRRYEAASSTLLALAPVGGRWAEDDHVLLWQEALSRLGAKRHHVGTMYPMWGNLEKYPATLLLYGLGLGAIHVDRLRFLGQLLKASILDDDQETLTVAQVLPASALDDGNGGIIGVLEGTTNRTVPLHSRIRTTLQPYVGPTIRDPGRYSFVFDQLELLLALGYTHAQPDYGWAPIGLWNRRNRNRDRIVEGIEASLTSERDDSRFVKSRIFGDTHQVCGQRLVTLKRFISKARHPY